VRRASTVSVRLAAERSYRTSSGEQQREQRFRKEEWDSILPQAGREHCRPVIVEGIGQKVSMYHAEKASVGKDSDNRDAGTPGAGHYSCPRDARPLLADQVRNIPLVLEAEVPAILNNLLS
jgi:hypothetical protein